MKKLIEIARRELAMISAAGCAMTRRTQSQKSMEVTVYAEYMLYHIEGLDADAIKAAVQTAFDKRDAASAALEKVADAPIDAEVMVGITYAMREGGCRHFERRVPLMALEQEIAYVKREATRGDFIEGVVLSGADELYHTRHSDTDAEWKACGDRNKLIKRGRADGRFNLILAAEGIEIARQAKYEGTSA